MPGIAPGRHLPKRFPTCRHSGAGPSVLRLSLVACQPSHLPSRSVREGSATALGNREAGPITRKRITNLIVLGLLLGGLSLAWEDAADSALRIGRFVAGTGALNQPNQVPQGIGTLGIRG